MTSIRKAPGKLVILGEFAVVEPGCAALVAAIDRYVTVRAQDLGIGGGVRVSSELISGTIDLDSDRSAAARQMPYIASAVSICREWLASPHRGAELTISSELHQRGVKLGLGSSGAVTVAVIDAVTSAWGASLDPTTLFRLSLIATARLDVSSSGIDVAAAVFGGWLGYRSPDRRAIVELAANDLHTAVHTHWPGHLVTAVTPPLERLLIGWTGAPAATTTQVAQLASSEEACGAVTRRFRHASEECVTAAIRLLTPASAFAPHTARGGGELSAYVRQFRSLLSQLDHDTGIGIFTERLHALCATAERSGAAAKPSGAGGGDCGIALAGSSVDVTELRNNWNAKGIHPLDAQVAAPISNTNDNDSLTAGKRHAL